MRFSAIIGTAGLILYTVLGYWAAEKTIWAGKLFFGSWSQIGFQKQITVIFLGWLLIPVAIIKVLCSH